MSYRSNCNSYFSLFKVMVIYLYFICESYTEGEKHIHTLYWIKILSFIKSLRWLNAKIIKIQLSWKQTVKSLGKSTFPIGTKFCLKSRKLQDWWLTYGQTWKNCSTETYPVSLCLLCPFLNYKVAMRIQAQKYYITI